MANFNDDQADTSVTVSQLELLSKTLVSWRIIDQQQPHFCLVD